MRALFDLEFRTFITPKIVQWAFVVGILAGTCLTALIDIGTLVNLDKRAHVGQARPATPGEV